MHPTFLSVVGDARWCVSGGPQYEDNGRHAVDFETFRNCRRPLFFLVVVLLANARDGPISTSEISQQLRYILLRGAPARLPNARELSSSSQLLLRDADAPASLPNARELPSSTLRDADAPARLPNTRELPNSSLRDRRAGTQRTGSSFFPDCDITVTFSCRAEHAMYHRFSGFSVLHLLL